MNQTPINRPEPRRGGCIKSLLITLLLIAVGYVGGVMSAAMFARSQIQQATTDPHGLSRLIVKRLDGKLDLTDEQAQQIQTLLNNRIDHLHRMVYDAWPLIDVELDNLGDEVSLILRDEQKTQWATLYADIRTQWFIRPAHPPPAPERKGWF